MTRVAVNPDLLNWALARADLTADALIKAFPKIHDWLQGEIQPTLKQLESFANKTHTAIGYLFLPEPPVETLPIPDFRTLADHQPAQPSPDLLDTIYAMQQRQAWLREDQIECEAEPLDFVGSATQQDDPEAVGREMRRLAGFEEGWASSVAGWRDAVSVLRRAIERLGIMTVINGVVGNSTNRVLNVEEFRGFALSDPYAPLIFVNGADAKSAQMFTLAHELAHIWLGESALTDMDPASLPGRQAGQPSQQLEDWCNRAAAEFLVPEAELRLYWHDVRHDEVSFELTARHFKVSPIVAGRRAMDLRLVDRAVFFDFYQAYINEERRQKKKASGGDFYNNQNTRVGELFATQVIRAAMEGRVGFREAYNLTGLNGGTFQKYAHRLGFELP